MGLHLHLSHTTWRTATYFSALRFNCFIIYKSSDKFEQEKKMEVKPVFTY